MLLLDRLVQELHASTQSSYRGRRCPSEFCKLDDSDDQCIDLCGLTSLNILKRRRFVGANLCCPANPPLHCDIERQAKAGGDRCGFLHSSADHGDRWREGRHDVQGRMRHGTDRIEAKIPKQLDPHVGPDAVQNGGLEARCRKCFAQALHAVSSGAVQLSQRQERPFSVLDLPRGAKVSCRIRDAANDPLCRNCPQYPTAGVH
mmetsp:Transcript_86005/g.216493  ORF Transcript_86005/g.216493 Transcript_86005/m.216493 type:complete len:203 (+) Transcript_86005:100-708(+)